MKIENGILQATKAEIIDLLYNDLNHKQETDCYRKTLVEAIINGSFLNAKNLHWLREKIKCIISSNKGYRVTNGLPDTEITGFLID
jgi:hypothetical protein